MSDQLPDLWILVVSRDPAEVEELLNRDDFPTERIVFVTNYPVWLPGRLWQVTHIHVPGARTDAALLNRGLRAIRDLQDPGSLWDVALGQTDKLSVESLDSLRSHMRFVDVAMAEADSPTHLGDCSYLIDVRDAAWAPSDAVVIAGELALRFDESFRFDCDAWIDFGRRTRALGGFVRVAIPEMELV